MSDNNGGNPLLEKVWGVKEILKRDFESEGANTVLGGGLLSIGDIMVLGGGSKMGKSVFVMNMGLCLAAGRPFLDRFEVPKPVDVLYLQGEISDKSIKGRMERMVYDFDFLDEVDERFHGISVKGMKLTRNISLDHLRGVIRQFNAQVLIVDPLYKFFDGDENYAKDMAAFFDRIDWLTDSLKICTVIVHHHGKPSEVKKRGAQNLRGSSAIFDYGDSYLTLTRYDGNKPRAYVGLEFELRNAEEPDKMKLYRNPDTLWYEVLSVDSTGDVKPRHVTGILREGGGQMMKGDLVKAIMEDRSVSRRVAEDAMLVCMARGEVGHRQVKGRGNPVELYLLEQGELL